MEVTLARTLGSEPGLLKEVIDNLGPFYFLGFLADNHADVLAKTGRVVVPDGLCISESF